MKTAKHGQDLRWVTLLIVLANTAFNYLTLILPVGRPIQEVTQYYHTLFVPADYAFSIWGIIYLSFIIYCIYQLRPAQQEKLLFNHLSVTLIFTNVLTFAWIIAYRTDYIGLSMLIMIILAGLGVNMFQKIKQARQHYIYTSWLSVPFSLFLGWITVAFIANFTTWLTSMGWWASASSEPLVTIILIILAAGAGIIVCSLFKDAVYPLTISWALIAIWVAIQHVHTGVAFTALAAGIIVFVGSVVTMIRTLFLHKQYTSYTSPQVKIIH